MTEWNGNDGAPWVALQLTTFDALISPVATLSDIGDSGLGIFLKLDGTSVMSGALDLGINDILNGNIIEGDIFRPRSTTLSIQDDEGDVRILVGGLLQLNDTDATVVLQIGVGLTELFTTLDMSNNQIIDVSNVVATNLVIGKDWQFALSPGAFKDSGGSNRIIFQAAGEITMEVSTSMKDGAYISGYDASPPLYGGGDTFWYQSRNIRFKDTAGPPSDAEGVDGDVCLIYTF